MRRDLRWHVYEPRLATSDLARLVAVVEADELRGVLGLRTLRGAGEP